MRAQLEMIGGHSILFQLGPSLTARPNHPERCYRSLPDTRTRHLRKTLLTHTCDMEGHFTGQRLASDYYRNRCAPPDQTTESISAIAILHLHRARPVPRCTNELTP
jgi:hypothetical protein